ncbi:unnamed protein product [Linum tenue]|uniref:Uncharacterized protein n=1 Tax=Linum tenue TaxID=586396 RepID=A0AAV0K3K3_9ROSI|nr:unnamed protein product [Linum tenue]
MPSNGYPKEVKYETVDEHMRNESGILLNQKKYKLKAEKVSVVCSSCGASSSSLSSSSRPSSGNGVLRRDLMLFGLCSFSGFSGSNFRWGSSDH